MSEAKRMLVKLNLNEAQVLKLEKLKEVTGEKAGSKAALFALDNYRQLDIERQELFYKHEELQHELEIIREAYQKIAEAKQTLDFYLMPKA